MDTTSESADGAARWGLPVSEIERLGARLLTFFETFRWCLLTTTRDTSLYGFWYVSALLRMETGRNMTAIGRQTGVAGQNMQHFISNSPWSASTLIGEVQSVVRYHPDLQEAVLVLDESAEVKAGDHSAGAGRQHNGRLGKIEMSQVGVFAALVTPQVTTWIDGELYLPESWFTPEAAAQRKQAGVPETLRFQTKPELAWRLVQRLQTNQLPFVAVAMDDLYGRNVRLRQQLDTAGIEYYGDVPVNTTVYLERPQVQYVPRKRGKGKPPKRQVSVPGYHVSQVAAATTMERATLTVRPTERGTLSATFSRCRVWTLAGDTPRQEWLLVRQSGDEVTYALSNAALTTDLATMAARKTQRYFIERSNQDAKSELGWDEFQATKYRAWQHHLALTILASWFISETRLDWLQRCPHDPALLSAYDIDVLPALSVANVRLLLRTVMPLPQLSLDQAIALVMEHLDNRTRSRRSRLKQQALAPPLPVPLPISVPVPIM